MDRLKRKPFVFGSLAVLLLVGLAAWKFAAPSAAEAPRLERYLPAETVGFVQVNNLRAQALNVIESEAWREFTRENQAASSLFMIGANHAGVLDASYAVALVGTGAGPDGRPRPSFALVGEFSSEDARRTFRDRALRLARGDSKGEETNKVEPYGDAKITTVSRGAGRDFSYSTASTWLIFSNDADAVKKLLDVRAGKAPSLESSETFKQARARAAHTDGVFGFLDGAALTRVVDAAPAGEREGAEAFRRLFHGSGADSVQAVAFTSSFAGGRVVERFFVVAPNREAGVMRAVSGNPPTGQALLALVPADALQAFDASIANAPQAFDEFHALVGQVAAQSGRKNLGDVLAEISSKTNIDLREDIIGALGAEICLAQFPAGGERVGAVILNLKDEQRFNAALGKLARHGNQTATARDYKGVQIWRLQGERGGALHYAFLGGNFVAGGEAPAVERVVDTAQGGPSLAAGAAYRAASGALPAGPQFVYYNSNADYLNRLGRALKSDDKEFKTDGQSASLRPSFAFGLTRADGFYVESHSPLGIFPRLLTSVTSKFAAEKKDAPKEKDAAKPAAAG